MNSLFEKILFPIFTGIIVVLLVSTPPKVTGDTADTFFASYFSKVTQETQRHWLYENDLTFSYRSFENWSSYEGFWKTQIRVTVSPAIPTQGNPEEFAVTLTFYPVNGGTSKVTVNYFLACKGFLGAILARDVLSGCPPSYIEIDRSQSSDSTH